MRYPRWLRRLRRAWTKPRDPATVSADEAWEAAIGGEVSFWREFLTTRGERYPGTYDSRVDPDLPLQPEIETLIDAPTGGRVRLLDVGAGPLTFLGRKSDRWELDITAVDALGDQYNALLDEMAVTPPVRTTACETERLSQLLPADSFDLVAARNTLDHSYDPVRAIQEMVTCAKPGAPLVLIHHRNTGEDEHYRGMHQWNFEANDSTFIVWRPGTRTDVGMVLAGTASFERSWIDGTWEHIVLRKEPDQPTVE